MADNSFCNWLALASQNTLLRVQKEQTTGQLFTKKMPMRFRGELSLRPSKLGIGLNHTKDKQKHFGHWMVAMDGLRERSSWGNTLLVAGIDGATSARVVLPNFWWLHLPELQMSSGATANLMIHRIGDWHTGCDMRGVNIHARLGAAMHGDMHHVIHAALDRYPFFYACDRISPLRQPLQKIIGHKLRPVSGFLGHHDRKQSVLLQKGSGEGRTKS